MLTDLTLVEEKVIEFYKASLENDIEYYFNKVIFDSYIEKGIYRIGHVSDYLYEEEILQYYQFNNTLKEILSVDSIDTYGVADNINQIKRYYKKQIEDNENKYFITVEGVFQDEQPEKGGFRWHKHGEYIGDLDRQCEYLYDEEFDEDWQGYVLLFSLNKVIN